MYDTSIVHNRVRLIAILFTVVVLTGVTSATSGTRALPAKEAMMPAPTDPEHARLTAMCGTWDVEMTFWFQPGRPGITTKGTATIKPLFEGLFVEEHIDGSLNGTPFTTLSWTGFNAGTHQYEATRIATTNSARIAETGVYDEKAAQFELKADYALAGDTWHQRTVIRPLSAETMVASSYLRFGNVPEWKAVEIEYERKK